MSRPKGYGLAEMRWEYVQGAFEPHLYASYRDRHGQGMYWTQPLSAEIMADPDAAPEFLETMGRVAWEDFRYALDGRYDDPFAFWPRGPYRGVNRWAPASREA